VVAVAFLLLREKLPGFVAEPTEQLSALVEATVPAQQPAAPVAASPAAPDKSPQVLPVEGPALAAKPIHVVEPISPKAEPLAVLVKAQSPAAALPKASPPPSEHEASNQAQPTKPEPPPPAPTQTEPEPVQATAPFDKSAALTALTSVGKDAASCIKPDDPPGAANVLVTFAPSGRVTAANLVGPPFAGTPTGSCIAAKLRRAHIPPFVGDYTTVNRTLAVR
jgi:hypothetical protein